MKQRKFVFSSLEPRFSRKAQGLPINTIILLILGVLVLFVVSAIVYVQVTKTGKEIKGVQEANCSAPNTVEPIGTDCDVIYGSFKNVPIGQKVCCKPKTT